MEWYQKTNDEANSKIIQISFICIIHAYCCCCCYSFQSIQKVPLVTFGMPTIIKVMNPSARGEFKLRHLKIDKT